MPLAGIILALLWGLTVAPGLTSWVIAGLAVLLVAGLINACFRLVGG